MRAHFASLGVAGLCTLPTLAQQEIWSDQFGTIGHDAAFAIAPDGAGGVIIGGVVDGLLGDKHFGGQDIFLRRLDADGQEVWVKQLGTVQSDIVRGACPDGVGGVFASGETGGSFAGEFQGGESDAWIGRFNADGEAVWMDQIGTTADEFAFRGLTPDGQGGVYIVGGTTGVLEGEGNGERDAFIARYDANGGRAWMTQFGTEELDSANAVASDDAGGAFVGGITWGELGGPSSGDADNLSRPLRCRRLADQRRPIRHPTQ